MNEKGAKLGEILISKKLISHEQLEKALQMQSDTGEKLGEVLIKNGYASESEIIEALSLQTGIRAINLDNYPINAKAVEKISEKLAKRTNSVPIDIEGDRILTAMEDPLNIFDIEDIELESGMKAEAVYAAKTQITDAINKYMGSINTILAARDVKSDYDLKIMTEITGEENDYVKNSPVVRLVNSIINQGYVMNASDIHIEPYEKDIRVRLRIDGDLQEILAVPIQSLPLIITRLKVMASMNITEKRLPQDGRIELPIDNTVLDMRISTIPTVFGEKCVIRLLNREVYLKDKKDLGFTEENLKLFDFIIKSPNGIILITGPTGSGKSTTLYTFLNELNKINKNIITIEDPVEYKIHGINQVQVYDKIGLTFARGLRSILRQDPDIIMVGEIRDTETAEIAVRAAITGHLVMSTLHTNDASSCVIRLNDMGIEPYMIAASLKCVIAQRLLKRICPNCKTVYKANEYEKTILEIENDAFIFKGKGCPKCYNTGYSGRIAVHEIMIIDKDIRNLIYKGASAEKLNNLSAKKGMTTLKDNCRKLVMEGVVSIEEYSQIIFKL